MHALWADLQIVLTQMLICVLREFWLCPTICDATLGGTPEYASHLPLAVTGQHSGRP